MSYIPHAKVYFVRYPYCSFATERKVFLKFEILDVFKVYIYYIGHVVVSYISELVSWNC